MESKRKKILLNSLLVVVILAVAIGTTLKITSLKKSSAVDKVTEKVTLSTTAPTTKAQKENEAINEDGEVVIEENTEDDSNEKGSKEKVSTKNGTTSYSTTERTSVKTQLEEKDSQTTKKNNSTSSSSQKNTTTKETTTKNAKTYSCTIEIRCDTILNNMGDLKESKKGFVPSNGTVLATTKVEFKKGETAFDILKKACNAYGIQLEYSYTPTYDSYYVEGINNLYEFDCGSQSGWMYKVNGWFPNYGCSSFKMEDGDVMVWCYTCKDLGGDVGCYMN